MITTIPRADWLAAHPDDCCGNPDCKGSESHEPGERLATPRAPFTPARRQKILMRTYGGH